MIKFRSLLLAFGWLVAAFVEPKRNSFVSTLIRVQNLKSIYSQGTKDGEFGQSVAINIKAWERTS